MLSCLGRADNSLSWSTIIITALSLAYWRIARENLYLFISKLISIKIHAEKIYEVFRDIQDMYIRLVSIPCDYAIIALGSVARMEATPFSDLEFAILYSDPAIGDKIEYFRLLSHFLHLKVINLGETILPALAIKQLNDFQSSDPSDNWFYDSETPRGIAFDGAMPWASKTPLGRIETGFQDAIELIRTPEKMAQLQDEKFAMKEKYHLGKMGKI